jgi:hypothetical protein
MENNLPVFATPPEQSSKVDWLDLLGWSMKYIIVPLLPFFIGAGIRLIDNNGGWSWGMLHPSELSFSLAMFCILGNVYARKLEDEKIRETLSGLFIAGIVIFMSMFAFSVSQDSQLNNLRTDTVSTIISEANQKGALPYNEIKELAQEQNIQIIIHKLNVILSIVSIAGAIYIFMGLTFRHFYKLGEE